MSVPRSDHLTTRDGELILVTVETDSRDLEALLEALVRLPFPLNPQIHHPAAAGAPTRVDFPAYAGQFTRVRDQLQHWQVSTSSMLQAIAG